MIFGTHLLLFSRNADADRAFLRDTLELASVDAGEGWLVFRLPPAEIGVHPAQAEPPCGPDGMAAASLYFLCRDLASAIGRLAAKGIHCTPSQSAGWGTTTTFLLPGGSKIGLYEPRHPLAIAAES